MSSSLCVVVAIIFCTELILLSHCSSLTADKYRKLFVMSAVHSPNVFKSSILRWDIDETLQEKVGKNMNGELLFVAASQLSEAEEPLWAEGEGYLTIHATSSSTAVKEGHKIDEDVGSDDINVACVYMSVSGADGKYNDDPFSINIAIACPITSVVSKQVDSFSRGEVTVTLDPQCPSDPCAHSFVTKVPLSLIEAYQMETKPEIVISQHSKVKHAVVTVQTFKNRMTGPMLYMFTRHYHRLGYAVIVFDRFSLHKDVFNELMSPKFSNVYYYGYTMFERMFPSMYNSSYRDRQTEKFLHFHHFETKKHNRSYVEGRETQNQNSDKRKTYNFARQLHPEFDAMFYLDRDELLYCPPAKTDAGSSAPFPGDSLDSQRATQLAVIDHYTSRGVDMLSFQRFAYPARLPSNLSEIQIKSRVMRESLLDSFVPNCLQKGYAARSMSRLWECWGGHYERQGQFKSGDIRLGKICPFVGLHEPCLRCRCQKHQIVRRKQKKVGSLCHFMHLNNVHVKAWMNPKKWEEAFNDPNTAHMELWRNESER